MFNSDSERGKVILLVTIILFLYYTIWVIGLPFIDDSKIQSLFGSQDLALMVPAIAGLCFIGGLILFTVYNVKPYFSYDKLKKVHES
ncbi:PREDICTED: dolichol phosphate-mannose biosynthesis regulatory protein [Dufourea novaeangliae]|uniref:dolichol phosphate-mannose biosynthesis regulatory protein n=1 Tax=Dufourea novaeangliae TaxID=178035 RepID=UPI0007674131|nr:PREDICTED: dolichol phosphate-mannose biosynthesis regulatory protein [Dufourea novaeangliae]